MRIVFFGTPDFACPALKKIADLHEVSLVVTQPDARAGRGKKLKQSPLGDLAEDLELPLFKPESLKDFQVQERLREEKADVFIVVAYGKILPKEVLDLPKFGCFNIHGSLLPAYRGAAPIERAILNGDERTGISIMKMGVGLDDGPIALQESLEIGEKTSLELRCDLSQLGADQMVKALDLIQEGSLKLKDQDDSKATYAEKITKEDGLLNLGQDTVFQMLRKIQGMDGYKGAYFESSDGKMKVFKAKAIDKNLEDLLEVGKSLYLKASDGSIEVLEIQAPGKKRMNAKDYLRGNTIQWNKE